MGGCGAWRWVLSYVEEEFNRGVQLSLGVHAERLASVAGGDEREWAEMREYALE